MVLSLPSLGGFFFCRVNYFTKHLHGKKTRLIFASSNKPKASDMKTITAHKMNKVTNTDAELLAQGVVAFQIVRFVVDFYGNKIETTHDTKIMKDGRQVVIGQA